MPPDSNRLRPDPRSPVQPVRDPAPYLLAAFVAAVGIWIIQQNLQLRRATDQAGSPEPAQSAKGDVRAVFSADDYPVDAQTKGEEGTVRAKLSIDRNGRVSECSILSGSGSRSLDDATCRILRQRARFTPARDVNGKPIPSSYVVPPVVWRLEG